MNKRVTNVSPEKKYIDGPRPRGKKPIGNQRDAEMMKWTYFTPRERIAMAAALRCQGDQLIEAARDPILTAPERDSFLRLSMMTEHLLGTLERFDGGV